MSPLLFPGRAPCLPRAGPARLTRVATRGALAGEGMLWTPGVRRRSSPPGLSGCPRESLGTGKGHKPAGSGGGAWENAAADGGGEVVGRGRGAVGRGVSGPVLHSQVSRAGLRRTPRMGQSPVTGPHPWCPRPPSTHLSHPPDILPVLSAATQGLGQQGSHAQQRLATEGPVSHLGGGWPGPGGPSPQPTPPQRAPGPAWAPGAGRLGRASPGHPQGQQVGDGATERFSGPSPPLSQRDAGLPVWLSLEAQSADSDHCCSQNPQERVSFVPKAAARRGPREAPGVAER